MVCKVVAVMGVLSLLWSFYPYPFTARGFEAYEQLLSVLCVLMIANLIGIVAALVEGVFRRNWLEMGLAFLFAGGFLVLEFGVPVARGWVEQWTAPPEALVMRAASRGDAEIVKRLLGEGIDVNVYCGGETALHAAARNGYGDIVKLLIERGARIDAPDSRGHTPLHWAAGYYRTEVVQLLLANGADATVKNKGGETPLDCGQLGWGHDEKAQAEVVKLLRRHQGAD